MAKEIVQLCEVIEENGRRNADGTVTISFGDLFANYVYISDKVGMGVTYTHAGFEPIGIL